VKSLELFQANCYIIRRSRTAIKPLTGAPAALATPQNQELNQKNHNYTGFWHMQGKTVRGYPRKSSM